MPLRRKGMGLDARQSELGGCLFWRRGRFMGEVHPHQQQGGGAAKVFGCSSRQRDPFGVLPEEQTPWVLVVIALIPFAERQEAHDLRVCAERPIGLRFDLAPDE